MTVECLVPWEDYEKCQHSQYSLEHCIYDGPFSIYFQNVQTFSFVVRVEAHRAAQLTHDVAATLLVSGHLVTRDVTLWQRCRNVVATL